MYDDPFLSLISQSKSTVDCLIERNGGLCYNTTLIVQLLLFMETWSYDIISQFLVPCPLYTFLFLSSLSRACYVLTMASFPKIICRVRAIYPFSSKEPASLSFDKDDYIDVLAQLDSGWWDGW